MMLTQEQMDMQDFAVSVFKYKLGDTEATGHYMDLSCGDGDWWFYREWNDVMEHYDCYPVTEDNMREMEYPVLTI